MKKWHYIVIGVVAFALALGGVLYGVITHKEPGLLGVCWTNNGVGAYDDPLKDPHPECTQKVQWPKDRIPLHYRIDFEEDHADYVESVEAAVKLWNREIGEVFVPANGGLADIVIIWGPVEAGVDIGGSTTHMADENGLATGALVTLNAASDLHAVYRYAAHELGHVLGLAHDEAPRSIMFPTQPDVTTEMTFVLPSDYDKKLLRELYQQ